jgi:hypothetical protein
LWHRHRHGEFQLAVRRIESTQPGESLHGGDDAIAVGCLDCELCRLEFNALLGGEDAVDRRFMSDRQLHLLRVSAGEFKGDDCSNAASEHKCGLGGYGGENRGSVIGMPS